MSDQTNVMISIILRWFSESLSTLHSPLSFASLARPADGFPVFWPVSQDSAKESAAALHVHNQLQQDIREDGQKN